MHTIAREDKPVPFFKNGDRVKWYDSLEKKYYEGTVATAIPQSTPTYRLRLDVGWQWNPNTSRPSFGVLSHHIGEQIVVGNILENALKKLVEPKVENLTCVASAH